jgi:hypothetical protein
MVDSLFCLCCGPMSHVLEFGGIDRLLSFNARRFQHALLGRYSTCTPGYEGFWLVVRQAVDFFDRRPDAPFFNVIFVIKES